MSKIPKVILLIEKSRSCGRRLLQGIIQYSNLHGPWLYYMEPEFYRQDKRKSLSGLKPELLKSLHFSFLFSLSKIYPPSFWRIYPPFTRRRRNGYVLSARTMRTDTFS
jgi:hypothetical protein